MKKRSVTGRVSRFTQTQIIPALIIGVALFVGISAAIEADHEKHGSLQYQVVASIEECQYK